MYAMPNQNIGTANIKNLTPEVKLKIVKIKIGLIIKAFLGLEIINIIIPRIPNILNQGVNELVMYSKTL
tara:strand:- start:28 stop:234 length:207 start_codon:yes stop_codon:yes gene_type:complete